MLSEYEERLVKRRREVQELQEQRDRLLATQQKLLQLQQNFSENVSTRTFMHIYIYTHNNYIVWCLAINIFLQASPSSAKQKASSPKETSTRGPTNGTFYVLIVWQIMYVCT